MPVFRVERNKGYTVMSNYHLRDKSLSLKAKGLLAGMLLCRVNRERGPALLRGSLPVKTVPFPQALTASVSGAAASTINICAFVVLFRVLAALPPVHLPALALGALEMVTGTAALSPGRAGWVAAAIVGWGGLSVHCQALSVTAPAGLSFRWHWAGKAVQAGLSALLAAGAAALMWR